MVKISMILCRNVELQNDDDAYNYLFLYVILCLQNVSGTNFVGT